MKHLFMLVHFDKFINKLSVVTTDEVLYNGFNFKFRRDYCLLTLSS